MSRCDSTTRQTFLTETVVSVWIVLPSAQGRMQDLATTGSGVSGAEKRRCLREKLSILRHAPSVRLSNSVLLDRINFIKNLLTAKSNDCVPSCYGMRIGNRTRAFEWHTTSNDPQ